MPFYDVWEKKTVFMMNPGPPPGIWPPPGAGGPAPPTIPPGIWPGPRPSHPIMLPGMPGWGGGGPPVGPPGIWPGPHPSHPIMLPGMPGWAQPSPPDVTPPTEPSGTLPDFASPGFWTYVYYPAEARAGWIQTSLSHAPGHEPDHPETGLPGEWIAVYSNQVGYTYAWLATKEPEEPAAPTRTKKSREGTKHVKPGEP